MEKARGGSKELITSSGSILSLRGENQWASRPRAATLADRPTSACRRSSTHHEFLESRGMHFLHHDAKKGFISIAIQLICVFSCIFKVFHHDCNKNMQFNYLFCLLYIHAIFTKGASIKQKFVYFQYMYIETLFAI